MCNLESEKSNIVGLCSMAKSTVCEGGEELSGVGEVLELLVVMVGPDWLWEARHPHLHAAGLPAILAGQQVAQ